MALINTLREKMGRFLVIAVGFAIMSFILADLLGSNSTLFGNQNEIGEIAGNTITFDDFQQQVDRLSANYTLNFGRNPSENELRTLRQQAWDFLIIENAFNQEYQKIGLDVNDDEVVDMVQGRNISADIKQSFANPETGEFDRERLLGYLQSVKNAPVQQQAAWYLFERNLRPGRLRIKFDNLLLKTNYVTEEEAKKEYEEQITVAEVKYLYIPYFSIDSTGDVTESKLQEYLSDHASEFQVENTRSMDYVSFSIEPSAEDTLYFMQEMEELKEQLQIVNDDSVFARINSDGQYFYGTYNISNLPLEIAEIRESIAVGDVMGPELESAVLKLYKVSDIYEDTIYRAKASHILIKSKDDSNSAKTEAKREANRILREIQNGADFVEMAAQFGQDGTSTRGGDLGWGIQGRTWVSDFEKPIFSAIQEGLINRIIESEYGYHVIKVTGVKSNMNYKIAFIDREITPSDDTRNRIFREVGLFQAASVNKTDFHNNANKDSIRINNADKIGPNQRFVTGLGDARGIVQWLFNTASIGQVSDVFELDNYYVTAVMTSEQEKGMADLKDVRIQIETKVKNQLKADIIKQKLSDFTGTLDEIAEDYGSDANVYSSSDLKMNANFLSNVGLAPNAIGVIFALKDGERSDPIITDGGVVIVEMTNLTPASEIADYTSYKNQLIQSLNNSTSFGLSEAIKEYSDIKDLRYKFF